VGSSFWPGRRSQLGSCKFKELNPRAGPSRGTWSSVTKEKSSFCSHRQLRTVFSPSLFVNWKTHSCDGTENTASPAVVNGTEVVQSGTNVPYSRDERLQIGNRDQKSEIRNSDCHRKSSVIRESPRLFTRCARGMGLGGRG
jgi:hypothetical protein